MNEDSLFLFLVHIVGIESNPGPQLNNKKNIKIIHNNVCSLLPKLDLIEHEFQEYDVMYVFNFIYNYYDFFYESSVFSENYPLTYIFILLC
jgi:hypothetical protein